MVEYYNPNPDLLKAMDQLAQWRSAQMGGYTPQTQQLYGNVARQASQKGLGSLAGNIFKNGLRIAGPIGVAYNVLQGLNSPISASDIDYYTKLQQSAPFTQEQLSNLNYFGR